MRRTLLAGLLWVAVVRPVWAAWGTGGAVCSATEEPGSADNSMACTLATQNAEAGNVMICRVGIDNVGTTDGTSSEVTSVTDSGLNSYSPLGAYRNGQGTAATGAQVEVWYSKLTTQLTSGSSTITLTTANNITDKSMECSEFTIGAGNVVSVVGTIATEAADNADAGNLTVGSLANSEHLFLRAIATESNAATSMTATANYTLLPADGCTNTASGGEASDIGICTEYRILTGTSDSSNPALVDTTNDNASVYMALNEAAPSNRRIIRVD